MFYVVMIPALAISGYMLLYFNKLKKHDKVLYQLCQSRRESMDFVFEELDRLEKSDYVSIRNLIFTLNTSIKNYNAYKTVIFNFRKFLEYKREYDKIHGEIENNVEVTNEKIKKLYEKAVRSFLYGFLSYTPLIKSECAVRVILLVFAILARLGVRSINGAVQSIKEVREQGQLHGLLQN